MLSLQKFITITITITGNNTMYSNYRIGTRKFNSKLPIVIFQIKSICLIESENIGKPRMFVNNR